MRTSEILGSYEIRLHGDEPTAVVAELFHVARNHNGSGGTWTPVGHFSAAPRPAEPEAAAHWNAELLLRSDVAAELLDSALPDALADWLLEETACTAPLLVRVSTGKNTGSVIRGEIWDD